MGTGEVARYLGAYGSDRVQKAALFGSIPPFLLKTDDNPEGVDGSVFEGIKEQVLKDRYVWFKQFFDDFYNVDKLAPERISDEAWRASFQVACMGSAYSSYHCVDTWLTDFREDMPKIDVPTLVLHGTEDRILPYEATAARLPDLIDEVKVVPVEGGPHNIGWTHPEVLNPRIPGIPRGRPRGRRRGAGEGRHVGVRLLDVVLHPIDGGMRVLRRVRVGEVDAGRELDVELSRGIEPDVRRLDAGVEHVAAAPSVLGDEVEVPAGNLDPLGVLGKAEAEASCRRPPPARRRAARPPPRSRAGRAAPAAVPIEP